MKNLTTTDVGMLFAKVCWVIILVLIVYVAITSNITMRKKAVQVCVERTTYTEDWCNYLSK